MTSPPQQRKLNITLGLLGLAVCCCISLAVVLVFTDPFKMGVGEKILTLFKPAPNPTIRPTPDPCLKPQGPLITGCPAPDFSLTTFDGQEISLAGLRGKVVVINFWASWAYPCEADVTALQAAWNDYRARGDVVIIGIDYRDTDQNALEFIQKFTLTYPNGPDAGTRISQAYHITGVPETYIVDKTGNLAFSKTGPSLSADEVKAAVDPLLAP